MEVKLYQPIEGKKVFEGELLGLKDEVIRIKSENDEILEFDRKKVAVVRRVIKF